MMWTSRPKNHEMRVTPLTTEVCEMLRTAKKTRVKGRWIFQAEGGKPEGHFLRKFKGVAKSAGSELRGVPRRK